MHSDIESIKCEQALYSLFAGLYLTAPTHERLNALFDPEVISLLVQFCQDKSYQMSFEKFAKIIDEVPLEDLRAEFNDLFVVPTRTSYVAPYESCFREKRGSEIGYLWGKTAADVAKFYHDAGYEMKNLQGIFAPDHIGAELAFIAKLCADELQCMKNHDSERVRKIEHLRKTFLRRHVCEWIGAFSKAVGSSPSSNLYKHLGILATHLVRSDLNSSP